MLNSSSGKNGLFFFLCKLPEILAQILSYTGCILWDGVQQFLRLVKEWSNTQHKLEQSLGCFNLHQAAHVQMESFWQLGIAEALRWSSDISYAKGLGRGKVLSFYIGSMPATGSTYKMGISKQVIKRGVQLVCTTGLMQSIQSREPEYGPLSQLLISYSLPWDQLHDEGKQDLAYYEVMTKRYFKRFRGLYKHSWLSLETQTLFYATMCHAHWSTSNGGLRELEDL